MMYHITLGLFLFYKTNSSSKNGCLIHSQYFQGSTGFFLIKTAVLISENWRVLPLASLLLAFVWDSLPREMGWRQ